MRALTDADLLGRLSTLVAQERENVADIVEHLKEIDRRELVIDHGYPSLFVYCVKALGFSEAEAYLRIRAARSAREFPRLIEDLRSGRLRLDAVARLSPHLTAENNAELLDQAVGASKREVMSMVAQLTVEPAPQRDIVVPVAPPLEASAPEGPKVIAPPQHRFHFTGDSELFELVERLRQLLRHKYPDGRLESIFKDAAKVLVARIDPARPRRKIAPRPLRKRSRRVPEAVKRQVWERDGGRCAYTAEDGLRCGSRDAIEYDHVRPWALGGDSDSPDNIRLLCRAHNQRLARKQFVRGNSTAGC